MTTRSQRVTKHPQAEMFAKARDMIKLLNIQLNHFPAHEKYGLCQEIRLTMYRLYGQMVACQRRYHNKTTLTQMDVTLQQLRMLVNLAFELGYYHYKDKKKADYDANRRYTAASVVINEFGAMIGGWIKHLKRSTNQSW